MSNEEISKKLGKPFPPTAIKPHPNNRNLSYIEGHTIVHRLNEATDNRYDFRIVSQDMRPFGKTSKGDDRLLITAIVELTIPNLGTRQHMGVQVVNAASGGEDMWKGAITDGLKKCATLFGVALDLMGPDYEAGEIAQPPQRQQPQPRANAPMRPQEAHSGEKPVAMADTSDPITATALDSIRKRARERNVPVEVLDYLAWIHHNVDRLEELSYAQGRELYRTIDKPSDGELAEKVRRLQAEAMEAAAKKHHNDSETQAMIADFNAAHPGRFTR